MPWISKAMAPGMMGLVGLGIGGVKGMVAGAATGAGMSAAAENEELLRGYLKQIGLPEWVAGIPGKLGAALMVCDAPAEAFQRTIGILMQGFGEGISETIEHGPRAGADAGTKTSNNLYPMLTRPATLHTKAWT